MALKEHIAHILASMCTWLLRDVCKRSASQLPGVIALHVDSNYIEHAAVHLRDGSIVVCGTNGKTTTNNLIAQTLERAGFRVACNRVGANMPAGVAAALVQHSASDWASLEVDELSCATIIPALKPRYFVLLNLFRDQLDRVGEMDRVQDTIATALIASPATMLIVCADDPLSMAVAHRVQKAGNPVRYVGVAQTLPALIDRVPEARFCQLCGAKLLYHSRTYAQLGNFYCPSCEFKRPQLDYAARDISISEVGLSCIIEHTAPHTAQDDGARDDSPAQSQSHDVASSASSVQIHAAFSGMYMVYNIACAWSALSEVGVQVQYFEETLQQFHPQNGRLQHFVYKGMPIILNLAKNPTGFNQNISLLQQDTRRKHIYICINDNDNDGCDVSWLWDVDFERLASEDKPHLMCGGTRACDMRVRLKYAGFDSSLAADIDEALAACTAVSADLSSYPLYVLTNYSALWPVKARLEQLCSNSDCKTA